MKSPKINTPITTHCSYDTDPHLVKKHKEDPVFRKLQTQQTAKSISIIDGWLAFNAP